MPLICRPVYFEWTIVRSRGILFLGVLQWIRSLYRRLLLATCYSTHPQEIILPTTFTETLHSWYNFYMLIGTAAATLAGLMFVAISLAMNVMSGTSQEIFDLFVTPTVMYFASAVLVSALMLVPIITPTTLALVLLVVGGIGFWITVAYVRAIIGIAKRAGDFHWSDWLGEVILPLASYPLILAAALLFAFSRSTLAFAFLALGPVTLLLSGITNTWSVVMSAAKRHAESGQQEE